MKTLKNPLDAMRLDYITENADAMIVRVLALRLACMSGDIDALDASFDAIRIIGREIAATRKEIETIETADSKHSEAA